MTRCHFLSAVFIFGEMFSAVGASLLATFILDFAIQTEVLYDLSGSLTYMSCILMALLWRRQDGDNPEAPANNISDLSARQIVAAVMVLVWCTRLGIFLFLRVLRVPDKRFEELKQNFLKFAIPWFLQVIWIFLTALPVFIILGNPAQSQPSFGISDIIGLIIWAFGFTVEVVADTQKLIFKNKNPKAFIRTGIWKYSRYANYNGEITLWIGMFIFCARGFVYDWEWVGIISPIFVACLILFVSGVALLEKSSEERYGNDPEYIDYKKRTSKFFLWPPKKA